MVCRVSIVMPVLNGMPYFEKALHSARNQTLQEIEILVIDAGSTDGTLEYIQKSVEEDSRVKLLQTNKKSMGHQYNLGIRNATGQYVGFLESDDYIDSHMMEILYRAAGSHNLPESVKSDFTMFFDDADGKEFSIYYHVLLRARNDLYNSDLSLSSCPGLIYRDVNMWNGIYRRDFLLRENIELNETRGAAYQDTGFIEQVHLLAKRQIFIKDSFYHYRRDNQASSSFKDVVPFVIQELTYMLDFLDKHHKERALYTSFVMARLFNFFNCIIGKRIRNGMNDTLKEQVDELRCRLRIFLDGLDCNQRQELLYNEWLYVFLNYPQLYQDMTMRWAEKTEFEIRNFKGALEKYPRVVIVGAGEAGQSVYALLRSNHFNGTVCFCDNNNALHHTYLMGLLILPIEDAVERYRDALFVISSRGFLAELVHQLFLLGIKRMQMICAPDVSPHSSMEIKW